MAMCIAVPTVGGEGGENAGGTGVWILPRSSFLCAPSAAAGESYTIQNFNRGLVLRVSPELGPVVAVITDSVSGVQIPLAVHGRDVILPASVLTGLVGAGVGDVSLVIFDSHQQGYCLDGNIRSGAGNSGGSSATFTVQ